MIIRPAVAADAADMATLLNAIIIAGGTTAHQRAFDADQMLHHYIAPSALISCQVAEAESKINGFQWLGWFGPDDKMPKNWASIASFVALDAAGQGIGKHLFAATKTAAQKTQVTAIDATIRADNVPGLRYYSGLGFVDYDRLIGIQLQDGTCADRIRKRYDISCFRRDQQSG